MPDSLSRENRWVGVVVFESQAPAEPPWFAEETVLVRAEDEEDARAKIRAWADAQCVPVATPDGQSFTTRMLAIARVYPMLFDLGAEDVTPLTTRPIDDLEALRRADYFVDAAMTRAQSGGGQEPVAKAREAAQSISEGINFVAFVQAMPEGTKLGQRRATMIASLDQLVRVLASMQGGPIAPEIMRTLTVQIGELRGALSESGATAITLAMKSQSAAILAAFALPT